MPSLTFVVDMSEHSCDWDHHSDHASDLAYETGMGLPSISWPASVRAASRSASRRLAGGIEILLAGVIGGGIIGHFHHKGLGLSQADRERITAELAGGKAAVGVLAPADEAEPITAKMTAMGGTVETHDVSDEALEALEAVAAAVPDAEAPLATV